MGFISHFSVLKNLQFSISKAEIQDRKLTPYSKRDLKERTWKFTKLKIENMKTLTETKSENYIMCNRFVIDKSGI